MTGLSEETIVALGTPAGRGAIAVVRLSGPGAVGLVRDGLGFSQKEIESRRATVGTIRDEKGTVIDRVVVTFFEGPNSYTGEDVIEVSCHGSPWICRAILDRCQAAGARLAEPGEFTMRAFLNGKMDLAEAEAVRDLVASQTSFQARLAREQAGGRLSHWLAPVRECLVEVLSQLETRLEFVEDDVSPEGLEQIADRLKGVQESLLGVLASFQTGHVVQAGVKVVLVGRPNTGKSSIFNRLLKMERAIVSTEPGTTRDSLHEMVDMEGVPVLLEDTAGIRESQNVVEALGVRRTRERLAEADLVLLVLDQSIPFEEEDERLWREVGEIPYLLLLNKGDLGRRLVVPEEVEGKARSVLSISALNGQGMEAVPQGIVEVVVPEWSEERETPMVTSVRHAGCLERGLVDIGRAEEDCRQGRSEEIAVYNLRCGLKALGQITGETTTEEILEEIFSTFCIGK